LERRVQMHFFILAILRIAPICRCADGAVVEHPRCRAPHHGLIPGAAWYYAHLPVETAQTGPWLPKKRAYVRFLPVPSSVGPFFKTEVKGTSLPLIKSFFRIAPILGSMPDSL
jgi:hypothetical protein